MARTILLFLSIAFLSVSGEPTLSQVRGEISCTDGTKVCRSERTLLPARVLPRPFSSIYGSQTADPSQIIEENVRAFFPLYVFEIKGLDLSDPVAPKGWYLVGAQVDQPIGWMRALDVIEWHQTLVVSYTHPGLGESARNPVLFFDELEVMKSILSKPIRSSLIAGAYKQIAKGVVPDGLISIEPRRFVNIDETFYILPILSYEQTELDLEDTVLLRVAAAVPRERSADPAEGTLQNEDVRRAAIESRISDVEGRLKDLKIDLVIAMDMTGSMQAYLDETKGAVAKIVQKLSATPAIADAIRFGLVGYRDDPGRASKLQWRTKEFTRELVEADQLVRILGSEANASPVTPDEWSEDVFAGVAKAVNAPWRDNSIRLMLIVGDASGHPSDSSKSGTRLDAFSLRSKMDAARIYTFSSYIRNPRARSDWDRAERQFAQLSTNPGLDFPVFTNIDAISPASYGEMIDELTSTVLALLQVVTSDTELTGEAIQKVFEGIPLDTPDAPSSEGEPIRDGDVGTGDSPPLESLAKSLVGAALIDYLGDTADPPRDIIGWIADRDLESPSKRAVDVSLILTRRQLNDLLTALELVTEAINTASLTQAAFFDTLQAIVAQSAVTPERIDFSSANTLGKTKLLPRWIEGLPYESEILAMNDAMYSSLTAGDLATMNSKLDAKINAYTDILVTPERWVPLNEGDDPVDYVVPLSIDLLP